ncbi:MAG: hypothetical protein ACYDH5_17950 [Acidimicrobiales bacterium]
MISAESFYVPEAGGLQQGDILLAGVARITGDDGYSTAQWEPLDTHDVHVDGVKSDGSAVRFFAGFGLVMVTSHDCQLEKEWNRRRSELLAQGRTEEEAAAEAAEDPTLDRTLVASPLVDPDDIPVDRGNLLAGHVVGYVPVPASPDGLVPECVVDLSYRCTLDRFDVVRVASITGLARSQLRYTLVRLDALRTPNLGFTVEDVIGRSIQRVDVPKRNPLTVRLVLDDGSAIELLQPGEPQGPSARASVRS